jgi:hypothetical protein
MAQSGDGDRALPARLASNPLTPFLVFDDSHPPMRHTPEADARALPLYAASIEDLGPCDFEKSHAARS